MTPNPPDRSRLTVRTLLATAALVLAACAGPVAADSARPDAPGTGGEHFAGARIAAVDWCGTGVIGDLNSDRSRGPAAARWAPGAHGADGPGGVAGEQHFPAPPDAGVSKVSVGRDALVSEASLNDVHFSPSCARPQGEGDEDPEDEDPEGAGPEGARDLAGLFGADDLVVVETVESQARWTPERGASARMEVHGLQVLGHDVDVGAGTYERTFTATGPDGPVEVDFTARASVTELPDGQSGATTAAAGLDMEFGVTGPAAEGREPEERTYRLELADVSVHSVRPVQGGPETQRERDPEPGDDLSPGVPPSPGGGEEDGDQDGSDGGSDGSQGSGGSGDSGDSGGSDGQDGAGDGDERGSDPGERGSDDGHGGQDGRDGRDDEGGSGSSQDGSQDGASDGSQDDGSGSGAGDSGGQEGRDGGGDGDPSSDPGAESGSERTPDRDDVAIDPQGSDTGSLPVTGTAILGMVAAGLLSFAAGAAALFLGRPRRSSAPEA
ncbi:hypothetical protein [Nocardiopsis baichengensis]|uniref:hypothetical protein n=1 Tax=Nocardiopsis baichengensis TaxID=280240 RepID=UPI001268CCD4|nr:hypothetical protein [Nocardiopsis baichengensis]